MSATTILDPLPPAITSPHELLEFVINRHLNEVCESDLAARAWR